MYLQGNTQVVTREHTEALFGIFVQIEVFGRLHTLFIADNYLFDFICAEI